MPLDDDKWEYSELYRGPKTDTDDKLHPILHSHILNRNRTDETWSAYSEFKVVKLPRGSEEDSWQFTPKRNLTNYTRRQKKTEEEFHQEQIAAFRKKENRIAQGSNDSTEETFDD